MRKFFLTIAAGVACLTALIIYFQGVHPYQIQVREHFVQSSQIPVTFEGARLVQLSDLRIKNQRDLRVLKRVVEQVNQLSPDMIAFTGDLFGSSVSADIMAETARLLGDLEADIGKVAVLGVMDLEREYDIMELLESVDFHVLRNESRDFFNGSMAGIGFLGMDPVTLGNRPQTILPRISREGTFQILLTHQGHLAATALDHHVGLKLSGYCLGRTAHTPTCSQFSSGDYRFADQMLVNISDGVGRGRGIFGFLKRPAIDSFLLMRQ